MKLRECMASSGRNRRGEIVVEREREREKESKRQGNKCEPPAARHQPSIIVY